MTHTWVSFPCLLYFIFCKARIFGVLWIRKHLFFPCHSDPSSTTPWIFRARQYPSYTKLRWLRKFPKRHIHLRVRNTFWWWHPNPIFWVTPRIFFRCLKGTPEVTWEASRHVSSVRALGDVWINVWHFFNPPKLNLKHSHFCYFSTGSPFCIYWTEELRVKCM